MVVASPGPFEASALFAREVPISVKIHLCDGTTRQLQHWLSFGHAVISKSVEVKVIAVAQVRTLAAARFAIAVKSGGPTGDCWQRHSLGWRPRCCVVEMEHVWWLVGTKRADRCWLFKQNCRRLHDRCSRGRSSFGCGRR